MMSSPGEQMEYGLSAGHAYTLLGTGTYRNEQLIKMRNPWGRNKYTGPWSNKDTVRWTADAKIKLGHDTINDGIFWMRFSDYHRLFEETTIGMYGDWHRD
jgi:hypothetical protein